MLAKTRQSPARDGQRRKRACAVEVETGHGRAHSIGTDSGREYAKDRGHARDSVAK